jgi:hypothetical protein
MDDVLERIERRLVGVEASLAELRGEVATRDEMDARFAMVPTRDEMDARFAMVPTRDEMDSRFALVPTRDEMNARFDQVPTRDEMNARFDQVPTRGEMNARFDEVRRHVDVLYEDTRDDIRLLGEGLVTLGERMERGFADLRELIAGSTRFWETAFANHEGRIRRLEDRG